MTFTREIKITGAYSFGPQYGQHGMDIWYYLKGPKGGISIRQFTPWCVEEKRVSNFAMYTTYPFEPTKELMRPNLADISYHSKTPLYDDQSALPNCTVTDEDCYCEGSSLYCKEFIEGFVHGGSDWLFARMEDYYRQVFENGPPVDLTPTPQTEPKD